MGDTTALNKTWSHQHPDGSMEEDSGNFMGSLSLQEIGLQSPYENIC